MLIPDEVFWVVAPYCVKVEVAKPFVSWYPSAALHHVTTEKTTRIFTAVKTLNVAT
jgi:hypothetical protein